VKEARAAAPRGGTRFTHDYLGYLLGQANHALFKEFDAHVREAGLGSLEWRVLAVLSGDSPMPVGRLAHEVLSQQPTVTKLLHRLVAQEWVALQDDPADQRRTLVSITSAGQKKVAPRPRTRGLRAGRALHRRGAAPEGPTQAPGAAALSEEPR
jgi:DNA-binding MarR family transcriptional regulator